jgi:hypothetical protein
MNRREAFKSLGFGIGALVVTPSVINLLQACQSEPPYDPIFLNRNDRTALTEIVGLIIPNDDKIPGARELGIDGFVDLYWKEVLPVEEQAFVRIGMTALNEVFTDTFDKKMHKGTTKEFDQLLTNYLKASKEQQSNYNKQIDAFVETLEKNPEAKPNKEAAAFAMLSGIRGLTIRGWKLHKEIGKNVLWYNPVPGEYLGCVPSNEAGNGNTMTLEY